MCVVKKIGGMVQAVLPRVAGMMGLCWDDGLGLAHTAESGPPFRSD